MHSTSSSSTNSDGDTVEQRQLMGRMGRLVLKELREILRDRRTIITLVVMPMLVYPLLAIVFQRFLVTSLTGDEQMPYIIGIESIDAHHELKEQLQGGEEGLATDALLDIDLTSEPVDDDGSTSRFPSLSELPTTKEDLPDSLQFYAVTRENAVRMVSDSMVHVAILARTPSGEESDEGLQNPVSWELVYRAGSPMSEKVLSFLESRLRKYNHAQLNEQLKSMGVAAAMPATTRRRAVSYAGAPTFSLAALIPLILVLTTVTGAVYPAIDLTAGERERGTLEILIAAPVPRLGLLMAKYVAVLAVALLTAIVNLLGMSITAHSTGLATALFGEAGLSLAVIAKVLVLLAIFAAFFSAVLLALTSFARSFKEAQAYIIPLMLLCLVPGIICLIPGLEFTGWLAITPLVNIVMLARDLLEGSVDPVLAAAAIVSTMMYVAAAIALAAQIFGADAILYGSQSTWSDVFRRPTTPQPAASVAAMMFSLALMFPCFFLFSNTLVRSPKLDMSERFLRSGLITALVFGGIPLAIALFSRVNWRSGSSFYRPSLVALLGAALFGLSLWPLAHEIVLLTRGLGMSDSLGEKVALVKTLLEQWKQVPWLVIVLSLGVAPGIFEEFFFRGLFFTSLRRDLKPWFTILCTAVLFGLFHVVAANVLAPERFLPSTLLGIVLGWVRYRTGSVIPCMVLHTLHNSFLLSVAYWRDDLMARGIGVQEESHFPALWLLLAVLGCGIAVLLVMMGKSQAGRMDGAAGS